MANMEEQGDDLARMLKFLLCCGEAEKITEEELGQANEKKEAGKELTERNYCIGNKVTDCGVEYDHGIVFCNPVCAKNYFRVRSEAGLGLEVTSSSFSSSSLPSLID